MNLADQHWIGTEADNTQKLTKLANLMWCRLGRLIRVRQQQTFQGSAKVEAYGLMKKGTCVLPLLLIEPAYQ